jgi:hypothetical protein
MPTSIAHGLTAIAVGAMLLDIDAIGRSFGLGNVAIFWGTTLSPILLFSQHS